MAYSFNQIILVGNLGHDPELRYTQGGKGVAQLSVATSRVWKDEGGNKQEAVDWHTVSVWGTSAEFISNAARKGDRVMIVGEYRSEKYTPKDGGAERTAWKVHTFNVMLLSPKRETPTANGEAPAPAPSTPASAKQDDLPF